MKKNKRILMSGYYGFNNSGDDAILKSIVDGFRQVNTNIDISVLSNSPLSTESIYGVRSVDRLSLLKVIKEMKGSNILISGGGSLLQDITSTRSILYYLAIMFLAEILNKPIMVYANGIGPINKKLNRTLTKHILNKAELITLRDENSKETLVEIGVHKEICVTADPVFTLKASDKTRVSEIFKMENIPTDKKFIGIGLRNWDNSEEFVQTISRIIPYIVDKYDVNIIVIPMHYPSDLEISRDVCALSKSEHCYIIENDYSVEDIMGIINELDLILAMRLHSLIYAATQAVPMIGLVYDPKITGFLESIEQPISLSTEDVKFEELCEKIQHVWENKDTITKELIVKRDELKDKALENISLALDILKRS